VEAVEKFGDLAVLAVRIFNVVSGSVESPCVERSDRT
jgi:hypothetical protein